MCLLAHTILSGLVMERPRARIVDVLPEIAASSVLCSVPLVSFFVPQLVRLSQASSIPLPPAPFKPHGANLLLRNLFPQTAVTTVQFAGVRIVKV